MQRSRRTIELGLCGVAVAALLGCVLSAGQKGELRDAIEGRGELSVTGLTQDELDGVVDLVYLTSLVVFAGLVLASVALLLGLRRKRSWATFWLVPLAVFVLAFAVTGIAGDVVAPRARGPLLAAAAAAVVLLLATVFSWWRQKPGSAESPASVASSA